MSPALILIDLQLAIDDPSWGRRNNLGAEANVGLLLDHWRHGNGPIVHVRHDSREPNSKPPPVNRCTRSSQGRHRCRARAC